MHRQIQQLLIGVAALALAPSCGSDAGTAEILEVPGSFATIQQAVDAAEPGDLILVAPGTYHERVAVSTPRITIRGEDRNTVILDGEDRLVDGIVVTADGVAVENLTVQRYRQNGVIVNGSSGRELPDGDVYGSETTALVGYRISYVTAANNGLYGLYAFASRDGLIEHSYASGSPDSGIYVGQCKPCNVLITDSIAELNAIGYYGTNASGGVYVIDSVFRSNRLGMTPNSQKMELLAPQVETVIAGNLVVDNDDPNAPPIARGFMGGGIAIGGGTSNLVLRNRVEGHDVYGIGLVDLNDFDPIANRIEGNVLAHNTLDLYYESRPGELASFDNCFVGNTFDSSAPPGIEEVLPCDGEASPFESTIITPPPAAPAIDYRTIPLPPPQPTMPGDVRTIPASPAGAPSIPDLSSVRVPDSR